jgi:hypothetical protein
LFFFVDKRWRLSFLIPSRSAVPNACQFYQYQFVDDAGCTTIFLVGHGKLLRVFFLLLVTLQHEEKGIS